MRARAKMKKMFEGVVYYTHRLYGAVVPWMWARLGVKHPGTGEPSIGVRDILMFSML